ncbi:dienelactone hydrolase family protein [Bordetella genomosp. 9]|uniref:Carboxymethylenebutenolidase n=1 Tax=Bordetella genomosp. 9 TaxID=1416803 RepID=A0A1W6YYL9_9BORD|nr:dienelactone hydrolase family protein [Bordetella genomosp. 9]ARP86044.1 carboxymethylenebutenolidase [Bordetella genomosp. 9]
MSFSPAAGNVQSTAIHTSPEGLTHGLIDLPVKDGTVPAYYATPEGKTNVPIVCVVQEIFGIHEHIQDICRRLAKEGYFAIAVNLYERQGDASTYTDIPTLIQDIVSKVPDEQVMADLDASVAWAAQHGGDDSRVGVTGFCWGGRITWMYTAYSPKVKAGVAWYGKLTQGHGPLIKRNAVDIAQELHGPVLGLYGGQDHSIPLADVDLMKQRLAAGNAHAKASRIDVYPDSGHAFLADYRPSYNEKDAKDAWSKMLAWFAQYLK